MKTLQEHYKAKYFAEVEKAADAVLELMGSSASTGDRRDENKP